MAVKSTRGINSRNRRKKKMKALQKSGCRCAICGTKLTYTTATLDHIVARSLGGSNANNNLQATCVPCNNKKSVRENKNNPRQWLTIQRGDQ